MSLDRPTEKIVYQLRDIWNKRDSYPNASGTIIQMIVEHHDEILREISDIDDGHTEKLFKEILFHALPGNIYQTSKAKTLFSLYVYYPDVGCAVLREALRHALADREADCCSQHSNDPQGYSQFIIDVIHFCEGVSLPWTRIEETIYQQQTNMTVEINQAIRACLDRRAATWGDFDTVYSALAAKIRDFPAKKLPELAHSFSSAELTPVTQNPLLMIRNEIARRLQIKITPATIELVVVFSEMIKAFDSDDHEKGITTALAAIKIFAERSRLPSFFGGKNRATLFAAFLGIPYPGASKSEILDAFCCKQFAAMPRIDRELREFRDQMEFKTLRYIPSPPA